MVAGTGQRRPVSQAQRRRRAGVDDQRRHGHVLEHHRPAAVVAGCRRWQVGPADLWRAQLRLQARGADQFWQRPVRPVPGTRPAARRVGVPALRCLPARQHHHRERHWLCAPARRRGGRPQLPQAVPGQGPAHAAHHQTTGQPPGLDVMAREERAAGGGRVHAGARQRGLWRSGRATNHGCRGQPGEPAPPGQLEYPADLRRGPAAIGYRCLWSVHCQSHIPLRLPTGRAAPAWRARSSS